MSQESTIRISHLRQESVNGYSRVTADVNDIPIWFESKDVTLSPSMDAYACAFLVVGLLRESRLVLDAPMSPALKKNMAMMFPIFNEWWGLPYLVPESPEEKLNGSVSFNGNGSSRETALLFSGGVDSFYSLFKGRYRPDRLVFVHGYDIPLEDEPRMDAFMNTFTQVAKEQNIRSVLIRTNLRKHPLIDSPHWMHVHGGALAATGHLLSDIVSRFMISSTNPYSVSVPWGSHWRIDELWSSEKLHMTHIGAERTRNEKLREIASEPIVQKNLRVCLANLTRTGNCSKCEKCLRTMLVLQQCGRLKDFSEVFDLSVPLEKRFEEAKPSMQTMEILLSGYEDILKDGLEPSLECAVRNFLGRYHERKNKNLGRVRRLLGKQVTSWLREKIFET